MAMLCNMERLTNRQRVWIWPLVLLLCHLFVRCSPIRMSDQQVAAYFAGKPVKPVFRFAEDRGQPVHYAYLQPSAAGADTLPLLVFVHGSPGAWNAFIGFFCDTALYNRARIMSIDRPGYGKSNVGKPEWSVKHQASALAAVIRKHKGRSACIIIGHSYGGPVVARLAMDFPELANGLILVAPSIDPELEPDLWYRKAGDRKLIRPLLPDELDVSNQEIIPLKSELEAMLPLWKSITIPVVVIQGTDDDLVPPGNAGFAKKMLVNAPAEVWLLPQMNHFIPWRCPEKIDEAILALLPRLPSKRYN